MPLLLVFGMMFSLFMPTPALAIGISPSTVIVNDVLSGTSVRSEINFSRGNPSKDQDAKVIIEGPAAAYIEPLKGLNLVLPKGEQTINYPFKINAGHLAAGKYEATITIEPIEKKDPNFSGNRVLAGAQGKIRFNVTNTSKEQYAIAQIIVSDQEEFQPFGFSFTINNTGNVDTRPGKIEMKAVDVSDASKVFSTIFLADSIAIVKTFSQQDIALSSKDLSLPRGQYSIMVVIYSSLGEKIAEQTFPAIMVWPQGSLAQKGEFSDFHADKTSYQSGELAGFSGTFKNTGSSVLTANLILEVYQGDKRLEVLRGDSVFIPLHEEQTLENTYRLTQGGSYKIKAYVQYGPRKTSVVEATFQVSAIGGSSMAFVLVGLSVLAAAVLWFFKRKKLRSKQK